MTTAVFPQDLTTSARAGSTGMDTTITLGALALLLTAGVLTFEPAFGGARGLVAAGGGVLLGLLVGTVAARLRWSDLSTAAAVTATYLLFGGPLALPRTTINGFIPTLDSFQRLVPLAVQSWRDLLTVTTPAGSFTGPAVVPYLSGLVCATVAASIALRTRRPMWALLPTLVFLLVAIAWGTHRAPYAAAIGGGFAVVAVVWAAWTENRRRARTNAELLGVAASPVSPRSRILGVGILAGALAVSVLGTPALMSGTNRTVLRDHVAPPLDLHNYPSPLTGYRMMETDQKDTVLMTVDGLPAGTRLRLATMDAYDGTVYSVADDSAAFTRIGERRDGSVAGTAVEATVQVGDLSGVWVPTVGDLRGIEFTGAQAQRQADGLYHSEAGATTISTAALANGDSFRLRGTVPAGADRQAHRDTAVRPTALPVAQNVPEIIPQKAAELAGDGARTPMAQALAIEEALHTKGYYSNGSDGKSRAGHTAERIGSMLSAPVMIGDDEQYAVAMALMARQFGMPARVVMGFYPDPKVPATAAAWQVKGTEAHVWVEIAFLDMGWVAFDPTPDRDRVPKTDLPQPKPTPKPQVQPPPPPPTSPEIEAMTDRSDRRTGPKGHWLESFLAVLLVIAQVLGVALLVALPFLLVIGAKALRRLSRLRAERTADRVSGSWDEIVDAAVDLGTPAPRRSTRQGEALALAAAHPTVPLLGAAYAVDSAVFGPGDPDPTTVTATWQRTDDVITAMRADRPRWRRLLGRCSLRSFRRIRSGGPGLWWSALRRADGPASTGSSTPDSSPTGSGFRRAPRSRITRHRKERPTP